MLVVLGLSVSLASQLTRDQVTALTAGSDMELVVGGMNEKLESPPLFSRDIYEKFNS